VTKSGADHLVDDYLRALDRELGGLPRARRRELVQEIAEHIAEARAGSPSESEAEIRNLLDRLGEPADIAAEARERFGARPKGSGWDVVALVLILVGGVVLPVIGWLVGVVLLWVSETWTTREKLVGTLVVPGGLALPVFLLTIGAYSESCSGEVGGPVTCSGGPSVATQILGTILVVALFVAPLVTTVFLARRRARAVVLA
jgi:HAAS domain-containing protein